MTEVRRTAERFIQRWNANQLQEAVANQYLEDALLLPPNSEPVRGRAAILAKVQSLRDALGEFDDNGDYLIRATASGDSVSWVGQYTVRNGTLRLLTHELYVRQPDGSMKSAVEMVGLRDPGR